MTDTRVDDASAAAIREAIANGRPEDITTIVNTIVTDAPIPPRS